MVTQQDIQNIYQSYQQGKGRWRRLSRIDAPVMRFIGRELRRGHEEAWWNSRAFVYSIVARLPANAARLSYTKTMEVLQRLAEDEPLANAVLTLHGSGLLDRNRCQEVRDNGRVDSLARLFSVMSRVGLLNAGNYTALLRHYEFLPDLVVVMENLADTPHMMDLSQENLARILSHTEIRTLRVLAAGKLLSQRLFNIVTTLPPTETTVQALHELSVRQMTEAVRMERRGMAVASGMYALIRTGLLAGGSANTELLQEHWNPWSVTETMWCLMSAGLLNQRTFSAIVRHPGHRIIAGIVRLINKNGLLTPDSDDMIRIITRHPEPVTVLDTLLRIASVRQLSAENIQATLSRQDFSRWVAELFEANKLDASHMSALTLLADQGITNERAKDALVSHPRSQRIADLVVLLAGSRLLTLTNLRRVLDHPDLEEDNLDPPHLVDLLITVQATGALSQNMLTWMTDARMPAERREVLQLLAGKDWCNATLVNRVLTHHRPGQLLNLARLLEGAGLLDGDRFGRILASPALLSESFHGHLQEVAGARDLTGAIWDIMVGHALAHNPEQSLRRYVDRLLGRVQRPAVQAFVNRGQSTHTESVHRAVAESAGRLHQRYGAKVRQRREGLVFAEMREWLSPGRVRRDAYMSKRAVALRCLQRLTGVGSHFKENRSNVTLKQLLVSCWLAIHDDRRRLGKLEDAKTMLQEGLFEIQRGYNLSEQGVDDGRDDDTICMGGSFNKLIEKLQGVHPDAEVRFVTREMLSRKLPLTVREQAHAYLKGRHQALARHPEQFAQLLERLDAEGVEAIWTDIRAQVGDRLFEEFGSLFSGRQDVAFANTVDQGVWAEVTPLPRFESPQAKKARKGGVGATGASQAGMFAVRGEARGSATQQSAHGKVARRRGAVTATTMRGGTRR